MSILPLLWTVLYILLTKHEHYVYSMITAACISRNMFEELLYLFIPIYTLAISWNSSYLRITSCTEDV